MGSFQLKNNNNTQNIANNSNIVTLSDLVRSAFRVTTLDKDMLQQLITIGVPQSHANVIMKVVQKKFVQIKVDLKKIILRGKNTHNTQAKSYS